MVEGAVLDQEAAEGAEERLVAAEPDRQVEIGEAGTEAGQSGRGLGVLEAFEAYRGAG